MIGYGNYLNRVTIDGKDYYVRFTVQRRKGESGQHSSFVSNVNINRNPTKVAYDPSSIGRRRLDFDRISDAKLRTYFEKSKENADLITLGTKELSLEGPNFQKVGETYDEAMSKWKEANAIPDSATGLIEMLLDSKRVNTNLENRSAVHREYSHGCPDCTGNNLVHGNLEVKRH